MWLQRMFQGFKTNTHDRQEPRKSRGTFQIEFSGTHSPSCSFREIGQNIIFWRLVDDTIIENVHNPRAKIFKSINNKLTEDKRYMKAS